MYHCSLHVVHRSFPASAPLFVHQDGSAVWLVSLDTCWVLPSGLCAVLYLVLTVGRVLGLSSGVLIAFPAA
jgi:hypothetical protein